MDDLRVDRRTVLEAIAGAGAASLAGCATVGNPEDGPTTTLDDGTARELAARFAPTLYFDDREQWFPTDPRPYETERGSEPVVDGFAAFDGYTARYEDAGAPPDPTAFYHAVRYEGSPLAVVQFWLYSVFDQFATNFHWHDWEVFHAFVDTDAAEPRLYVASAHARAVPNNEFLDPDPGRIPAILPELGSHSSALSVNDRRARFQRFPAGEALADITNGTIEGIEDVAGIPIAYGLPRDEGYRLPYLVPELDGAPVYEHERLPSVDRADLVDGDVTVRSFDAPAAPPTELPGRNTGLVFQHAGRDAPDADVEYDLVPSSELEHIVDFTGPRLSFAFAVPDFAEDAVAKHITTAGVPWTDPRYDNPAADITDPNHRAALAERYDAIDDPGPITTVVAAVTEAVTSDRAPTNEGLTTEPTTVETVALLESEPVAVPTFRGIAAMRDVPEGDHRLTVNGAGVAPHSETVSVAADGDPIAAGVGGEIPLVAREHATKLEVDPRGAEADLTDLAVADDFAGRLYDAPLPGPDAVYLHRGGAYTTEFRDADGAVGATRVNPGEEATIRIEDPRTGKASLAAFLAAIAGETRADVAAAADGNDGGGPGNAVRGLARALAAVADAARRAAERAEAGDRGGANAALETVATRLERAVDRLAAARDALPDPIARAAGHRLDQAQRRSEQARAAGKL